VLKKTMTLKVVNKRLFGTIGGIENVVWPSLPLGPAATLTALLHQFEIFQWAPQAKIVERQYAQLAALATYAVRQSPYFRQRLEAAGLTVEELATPAGLRRLPLLTRAELQQTGDALFCAEVPKTHLPLNEGKSSGSTGQPVTVKKTAITNLFWWANMMREHFWHKRDFTEKLVNIRALATEVSVQKSWGPPVNMLFPSGQVMSLPSIFSPAKLIKTIEEFGGKNLLIYPSTLDALVSHCEKEKVSLSGIKHVWCIGETLKPELRQRAAALLGASIEDDYSSNEIGVMALQCPETGLYHVMAESIIIEVLDEAGEPCREGEIGKVVVTDLHNYATPMIRYDIGDYAEMGGDCPCGRGLPVLKAIKGRKRNLVVKPDGSRHWPPLTAAIFRSGLPIARFQFIQHSLEDVEVRLVTEAKFDTAQEAVLLEHVHKALDHPFNVRFVYFEGQLPLAPNRKFEDFICHV
jgi:phenylacetate-CoA ligase